MPRYRWGVSLLLLYHLIAVSVATLPDPAELDAVAPGQYSKESAVSRALTPTLDWCASWLSRVERLLYAMSRPLHVVTQPYINMGLAQKWKMFTSPQTDDHYMRLDYYVVSDAMVGPKVVQELVFPADREDQVRLRHQFRDKAIFSAVESYFVTLALNETDPSGARSPATVSAARDFVPLVRYFGNRFGAAYLAEGERVVRTELWYGSAPIPPPGQRVSEQTLNARLEALNEYRQGPKTTIRRSSYFSRGREEREVDIVWKLEYVYQP